MFLPSADCFSKSFFSFKKSFQEYYQSVIQLDPDQARQNVGPDLGSTCLQKLSADDSSRQIVNILHNSSNLIGCWESEQILNFNLIASAIIIFAAEGIKKDCRCFEDIRIDISCEMHAIFRIVK